MSVSWNLELLLNQPLESSGLDLSGLDLSGLDLSGLDQQLSDIVNHLNQGISLIREASETSETSELAALRPALVQLNRLASRKAKSAAAHTAALEYLIQAIALMPVNGWQSQYALMLHLHNEAAEVAYLKGALVVMQRTINTVLQQANDLLDKIDVYEIQIQATIGQHHFLQAVDITLNALAQLGVEIPARPDRIAVQQALQNTAERLSQQPIADLIHLPEMNDRRSLTIIRLLTKAVSAAYIARPDVLPLLVCAGLDRCLTDGNSPLSSFLYGWYGVILCGLSNGSNGSDEIGQAHLIGELALNLLEKIPAKDIQI